MKLAFTLENHIPDFIQAVEGKIEAQLLASALLLEGKVKEKISKGGSGRVYRVTGTKRATYQASSPGQPPALRLGHLRRSYKGLVEGSIYNAVGVVGSPLDYSVMLEFGTVRMKPRPHLEKTMRENKSEIEEIVRDIFR